MESKIMAKSNLTPKEVLEKRVINNKLLRVSTLGCDEKEIAPINIKNKKYVRHDREFKHESTFELNPFDIPAQKRVFTKKLKPKKIKTKPDTTGDIRTVCDIQPDFFKVIDGRPLRQSDDIKQYMTNIRDVTLYRANTGFIKDEIQRIDFDRRDEINEFEKLEKLYVASKTNFLTCLRQYFLVAKGVQDEAEKVVADLENVSDHLAEYYFNYVRLRNQIEVIKSKLAILVRYKAILTFLAPDWWQLEFGKQGLQWESSTDIELGAARPSIAAAQVKEKIMASLSSQPQLFFRKPRDLMLVFDNIRRQGQHYMDILNNNAKILSTVKQQRKEFDDELKILTEEMQVNIERYDRLITNLEEKVTSYKNAFHRILFNDFKHLYSDYGNIKLYTCVQYVHSRIYGDSADVKDEIKTLMGNIEGMYMKLYLSLDELDVKEVNLATKQIFAKDRELMSNAHYAQRELQQWKILRKALYASFEPSRRKKKV